MQDKALNAALLEAVIQNEPVEVRNLLELGADPNCHEDDALLRPLHLAALYNSPDVIGLLIAAGANLHALTDDFETAASIAIKYGHIEVENWINRFLLIAPSTVCLQ